MSTPPSSLMPPAERWLLALQDTHGHLRCPEPWQALTATQLEAELVRLRAGKVHHVEYFPFAYRPGEKLIVAAREGIALG